MLPRQCTQDYHVENPDLIIEKGTPILISVLALNHDPKFWKDPYVFNPDRFNDENRADKNQVNQPFYPFGDGPRNCIGLFPMKLN